MKPRSRRALLKLASALPVALPVFRAVADELAGAGTGPALSYRRIKDQLSGAGIAAGAVVLVDSGIRQFAGDGFYLYPDWGEPLVYRVKRSGEKLAFYYPGRKDPLWKTSADNCGTAFGGRVEGVVGPGQPEVLRELAATLPELKVPGLPYGTQ